MVAVSFRFVLQIQREHGARRSSVFPTRKLLGNIQEQTLLIANTLNRKDTKCRCSSVLCTWRVETYVKWFHHMLQTVHGRRFLGGASYCGSSWNDCARSVSFQCKQSDIWRRPITRDKLFAPCLSRKSIASVRKETHWQPKEDAEQKHSELASVKNRSIQSTDITCAFCIFIRLLERSHQKRFAKNGGAVIGQKAQFSHESEVTQWNLCSAFCRPKMCVFDKGRCVSKSSFSVVRNSQPQ